MIGDPEDDISTESYGMSEMDLTDLDEDQLQHDDDKMIVEDMDGEIDNVSVSPSMESRKRRHTR